MKKIMFNDRFGLTEAVLEGKKTVTRRIVCKPNYDEVFDDSVDRFNKGWIDYIELIDGRQAYTYKAPYKVGEVVAVAQNYREVLGHLKTTYGSSSSITRAFYRDYVLAGRIPGANKMFVRAELMPHQIRILSVTAEQLQDIADKDCMNEWIRVEYAPDGTAGYFIFDNKRMREKWFDSPRDAYATLIDKIHGKETWYANPWAWRIEFELVK
ncbi:MAG: hypothetical protein RRY33_08140 [Alistipes sp.]